MIRLVASSFFLTTLFALPLVHRLGSFQSLPSPRHLTQPQFSHWVLGEVEEVEMGKGELIVRLSDIWHAIPIELRTYRKVLRVYDTNKGMGLSSLDHQSSKRPLTT